MNIRNLCFIGPLGRKIYEFLGLIIKYLDFHLIIL